MPNTPAPAPAGRPRPAPEPPRRSRLRKWTHRLLKAGVAVCLLLVVLLFAGRAYFRFAGQRDLRAEKARLDASDPGWAFDDLMAARERAAPPEAENSAVVVRQVRALVPVPWSEWQKHATPTTAGPLNRRTELIVDAEAWENTRAARALGLTLHSKPRGYHVVEVTDSPLPMSLDETQGAREVAALLSIEVSVAAQAGEPAHALRAAHAVLNTGRSIGDEPTAMSQLVRLALGSISANNAMRVLALRDTRAAPRELAALQAALAAEADEPLAVAGLRGERAFVSRFYDRMENGTVTSDDLARLAGAERAAPEGRFLGYLQRGFLAEDHARYLRYMNGFLAALTGPPEARLDAIGAVERTIRNERDVRYLMAGLMAPAYMKVATSSLRHRAELLSASALIACERYRLARGRWPTSLADIPKDILPAVPADPFTGAALKFTKLPDGVAVYAEPPADFFTRYSSGSDRATNPLGGTELGWRLYDLAARGLPPAEKRDP